MRPILPLFLLLTACSSEHAQPQLAEGTYVGDGRDRLCIAGAPGAYRAGVIVYGKGDINCSAVGRLEHSPEGWNLVPRGEGDCNIPIAIQGSIARIGRITAACDYYCGPSASLAGKSFTRSDANDKAVDLAGDPLC